MTAPRGTTNGNARGSSYTRRRRRAWLVETFRADVDMLEPACRCYRCGKLLTVDTVTVDRIIPGAHGGRYVRGNIRPACGPCNSETGGAIRRLAAAHA
jgi:hypothetical protein